MRCLATLLIFLIHTSILAPVYSSEILQKHKKYAIRYSEIDDLKLSNTIDFSHEFKEGLIKMSDTLNIKLTYLLTVFHVETVGTFEPDKKSPIGATGLIQFTSSTARGLGTTTTKLSLMTRTEQLKYVAMYFDRIIKYYGPLNTLEDVFMAVHYPACIRSNLHSIIYKEGSKAYYNNRFNDRNNDGYVSKFEITSFVRSIYKKYYHNIILTNDRSI